MSRKENRPMNQQQQQQLSKCTVRKQLVRTTNSEPNKKVKVINHNICDNDNDDDSQHQVIARKQLLSSKFSTIHCDKLAAPELRSSLLIAKELDALRLTQPKQSAKTLDELTPRSKAIANEKVLKKLNFPTDQNLYKHLIPINVNDSALDVQTKKRHRRKKNAATSTDPEPYLVDYLRPIQPIEHRLSLDNDEFDARTLRKPDRNNYRNTYEFYQRHLCPNNSMKKSMRVKEV